MKRIGALISLLLLVPAFSCTKETGGGGGGSQEQKDNPDAPQGYVYIKAVSADPLHSGWSDGERFLVNGIKCSGIKFSDGTYNILVKKAEEYQVLYPCDIIGADNSVYLQRSQYYGRDSHPAKCYPMSGHLASSGGEVSLAGLCGQLSLSLDGKENVASIAVRDLSGTALCGSFIIKGGTIPNLESSDVLALDETVLNCISKTGSGISIDESGTVFNLVLPARSYPSGIRVTVSTVDNRAESFDIPAFTIKAGVAYQHKHTINIPGDQIFAFHFDNMSLGADPVSGRRGFKCPNPVSPDAFGFSVEATANSTEAGSAVFASGTAGGKFDMPEQYIISRRISDFVMLSNVQEFSGYIGCGAGGLSQAHIKLPRMSKIPSGVVCKAELSFRMAMQEGHSSEDIDFFRAYSTSGKVLELWIDGVKKADYTPSKVTAAGSGTMGDLTRWSSDFDHMGIEKYTTNYTVERVRVKPQDMGDWKWHDVRIMLGAVTSTTTVEICPNTTKTSSAAFFLDDIVVRRIDYDISKVDIVLPISTFIAGNNSTITERLRNEGKPLGYEKYIDIPFGPKLFFEDGTHGAFLPDATIKANIDAYVKCLSAAGYKVWQIHLPATDCTSNYNDDFFEYFSPDESVRLAAVERTLKIIEYCKPVQAKYLTIHATQTGRNNTSTEYRYENARDRGVASFKTIVEYASSYGMTYSDGTNPVICIENIQNTGTKYYNVCAKPEYMNYYCEKVPGLKICFDTGHAIVCASNPTYGTPLECQDYLKVLGKNVACLHIHGNGHNDVDRHCHCGYKNGLYSNVCGNDLIDWAKVYDVLVHDCGYRGVFTYETGSSAADHIDSFSNLAHNYYEEVLSR